MKISIGADHGGYILKNEIVKHLQSKGVVVIDRGTNNADSVDYPDYAQMVGNDIKDGTSQMGVLVCTSGIGMSIAANKVKKVRAALCHNLDSAKFSRLHNDANVICMGSKYVPADLAIEMVDTFISTLFEGGRHERRVCKMMLE